MRGPILLVMAGLLAAVSPLAAEVRLPGLISDHMILQQGKPARVWGWATPGEQVVVRFAGQALHGHADSTGHWQVWLQPLPSSAPGEMIVEGSNRLVVHDVLVGEVWIGAGQSNMERALHFVTNYEAVAAHSANPQIRFFVVDHAVAAQPSEDVKGSWQIASPKSVRNVSGTAYFFAKELQAAHRVPVGIVESAYGGTRIEAWMSAETLSANPALHFIAEGWKQHLADMPRLNEQYRRNLESWQAKFSPEERQQYAVGKIPPGVPAEPRGEGSQSQPSGLWNGMVAPIAPYTVRGLLWYQGENNAGAYSFVYRDLFLAMIRSWRQQWGEVDLPFLFVQLSRYKCGTNYAVLRESQSEALALANTAMVVSADVGMIQDVHYPDKEPIGHRLYLAAESLTYGSHLPLSGPRLVRLTAEEGTLRLWFTATEGGLQLRLSRVPEFAPLQPLTPLWEKADGKAVVLREPSADESASAFLLAGVDGVFFPAEATVEGSTLALRSARVPSPQSVCYAFRDDTPALPLWNGSQLPASPFRASIRPGYLPKCPASTPGRP